MAIKASPHAGLPTLITAVDPLQVKETRPNAPTKHKPVTPYSALCTLMIWLEMYSLNFKPFNLRNADLSVVINRNTGTQYGCFVGVNGPCLQVCIFEGYSTYLRFTANFSLNPQLSSNPTLRFVGHGGKDTAEVVS